MKLVSDIVAWELFLSELLAPDIKPTLLAFHYLGRRKVDQDKLSKKIGFCLFVHFFSFSCSVLQNCFTGTHFLINGFFYARATNTVLPIPRYHNIYISP
jgi:hypothetical protein